MYTYGLLLRMNEHIVKAVEIFGTDAAFSRALNISKTAVKKMKIGKIRITAERAKQIHELTNGQIPKHQLRPDIFDAPHH